MQKPRHPAHPQCDTLLVVVKTVGKFFVAPTLPYSSQHYCGGNIKQGSAVAAPRKEENSANVHVCTIFCSQSASVPTHRNNVELVLSSNLRAAYS